MISEKAIREVRNLAEENSEKDAAIELRQAVVDAARSRDMYIAVCEIINALGFDSRKDSPQGAAIRRALCERFLGRDWYSVK